MALGEQVQVVPEPSYVRQQDILPIDLLAEAQVTVIGVGAIGSMAAITLAKMGIGRLTLYDRDTVEPHNLPNQWFRISDLGQTKVQALKATLDAFGAQQVTAIPRFYAAQPVEGIVVCAMDSMDARTRVWKAIKANRNVTTYIDGRMGAEVGRVLTVNTRDPLSVRDYEEELYPSSEAFQAPCTARATIYCASGLGALMAAKVAKILLHRPHRRELTVDFRQAILM